MSDELRKALESLKGYVMSAEELEAQRISFVFGNGSSDDHDTKESVKKAIESAEMA